MPLFFTCLAAFMLSAFIGAHVAYNPVAAHAKLLWLSGAAALGVALAVQPRRWLWWTLGALSVVGAGVAAYFLLTYNWQARPGYFGFISQAGAWWQSVRPALNWPELDKNFASGWLVVFWPLALALARRGWAERSTPLILVGGLTGGLMTLTLVLATSRGAWLGLGVALALWLAWEANRRWLARWPRWAFPVGVAGAIVLGALVVGLVFPGGWVALANRLPGEDDAGVRSDLYTNTWHLIADMPLTGGGLEAFPGLYSRYMLVIPDFFVRYAHNFYLDVALEQGVLGALSVLGLAVLSIWALVRPHPPAAALPHADYVRHALALGLLAAAVHGLMDNPLHGMGGSLWLFVLPGLAAIFLPPVRLNRAAWAGAGALAGLMALWLMTTPVLTFNLMAVRMAQVELRGWPEQRWDDNNRAANWQDLRTELEALVARHPELAGARYRLALLAVGDYPAQIAWLEPAHAVGSHHIGVNKTLGYAYLWQGQVAAAQPLLSSAHNIHAELAAYAWWWETQNQSEKAAWATDLAQRLAQR